jgi:hypothetical protein
LLHHLGIKGLLLLEFDGLEQFLLRGSGVRILHLDLRWGLHLHHSAAIVLSRISLVALCLVLRILGREVMVHLRSLEGGIVGVVS